MIKVPCIREAPVVLSDSPPRHGRYYVKPQGYVLSNALFVSFHDHLIFFRAIKFPLRTSIQSVSNETWQRDRSIKKIVNLAGYVYPTISLVHFNGLTSIVLSTQYHLSMIQVVSFHKSAGGGMGANLLFSEFILGMLRNNRQVGKLYEMT